MQILETYSSREEYSQTQIRRSQSKFQYCKVSIRFVQRWKQALIPARAGVRGPILCLGTRNGREVDVFRIVFFGSVVRRFLAGLCERKRFGFTSRFPVLESWGRCDADAVTDGSVIGVEINPDGKRGDVRVGSFDRLPQEWTGRFGIVFSNSFDHSFAPADTAREWARVLAPGGFFIINFVGESVNPTVTDPVGAITLQDILQLFPGELVYYTKYQGNYQEAIIRKTA